MYSSRLGKRGEGEVPASVSITIKYCHTPVSISAEMILAKAQAVNNCTQESSHLSVYFLEKSWKNEIMMTLSKQHIANLPEKCLHPT